MNRALYRSHGAGDSELLIRPQFEGRAFRTAARPAASSQKWRGGQKEIPTMLPKSLITALIATAIIGTAAWYVAANSAALLDAAHDLIACPNC